MKSKIISVVLCLGVILTLMLVPVAPLGKVALAQSHIGVNVTPQQTTVGFSESFNVVVWIDDSLAENYDGVGIRLIYNTTYINATSVTDAGTFDWVLDSGTIDNAWNATHGLVKYDAANTGGPLNTSNPACTVSFMSSAANTGISGLNFIYIGADAATSVTLTGGDILNWTYVVNGTVRTGMPALTVNVTPAGMGGVDITGASIPPSYPNTTTWDWDQNVTLEAVNSTPGWRFHHWSGNLSGNTTPTSVTMNASTKNVTANFTEAPPAILADPSSLTFSASVGEDPANQTLDICNDGGHILNWTLNDGPGWLIVRPLSGGNLGAEDCNSTQVGVNTTGLAQGTYYANITITGNGTVEVPVTLNLGVPGISVSPTSLTFTTSVGVNPPSQTLEVCNSGTGTLDWELTDSAGWLIGSPTSGSLDEDECEDVTVSVDVAGMEAGDYTATITISGSDEEKVPVSLHIVSAMPEMPVGPASVSASGLSITPQQVQPGRDVTISVNVANTGGATGSYNAVLYINGVVEDSQSVSVAGGASKNVIFTVSKTKAGVYDVSLAGQNGQFEVVGGGGWFGGGLGTGGIIAIVVVVIVLIVAVIFILRGTARPE